MTEINTITEEKILQALSLVIDPELDRDLVSLNMVGEIKISGSNVQVTILLTTPACPMKERIRSDAKSAVSKIPGVSQVSIILAANVPGDKISRGDANNNIKFAIAVASGKGGVGKTSVAVNLAVSLAGMGAKVGLLDADIYGPNVPTMMGLTDLPPHANKKIMPAFAHGVKTISIGFMVEPGKPLIWRGPMLHSAIKQFVNDVDWGELDYLIIDLPPGTGDAQLSLSQHLPLSGVIIVTLPQDISLEDASRGLNMFVELNVPIIGVVENMSYLELPDGSRMDIFGQGGGEKLADQSGVPFLVSIPIEAELRKSGDEGIPYVISHPESNTAKIIIQLASRIAANLSISALSGSKV